MTNFVGSPSGAVKSEEERVLAARREFFARDLARRNLADYMRYVTGGTVAFPRHIKLLIEKLEAVERGEIKRLIVSMPPRHGKSFTVSKFFASWFIGRNPDKPVMLCSYGAKFAEKWGGRARALVDAHGEKLWGIKISDDTSAKGEWEIAGREGGMKTAGVGGDLTGRGCAVLAIDDVVKNREEANSPTYRENTWEWFTSTAYSRLEPDGACIVILTRWHEDDLVGRLIAAEKEGGEKWEKVVFPAIAEDDDILGRKPGEALWPERFSAEILKRIETVQGSHWWHSLYQQTPRAREGNIFKRHWMRYYVRDGDKYVGDGVQASLDAMTRFSTIDPGFSERGTADNTAICVWGFAAGRLWLLHVIAERITESAVDARLRGIETDFRCRVHYIEEGAFKKAEGLIKYLRSQGRPMRVLGKEHGTSKDKEQRAHDATPRLEAGLVLIPMHAEWRSAFDDELYAFPRGERDDRADAFSYGILVAPWNSGAAPMDLFGDQRRVSDVRAALELIRPGR